MPSRRSILVGLGGLVAGGGALIGTGAFTTVEAERTVNVETAGDADAFLGLAPADRDDESGTQNAYVFETEGTVEINLDGTGSNDNADGLNQNARTTFRRLVSVTNNGTQDITSFTLSFNNLDDTTTVSASDTFDFPIDDSDGDWSTKVDNGEDILNSSNTDLPALNSIGPGESITFGIEVDLINGGLEGDLPEESSLAGDDDYTLTIEAETQNSN